MRSQIRQAASLAFGFVVMTALLLTGAPAHAQPGPYPNRTIKIIVPYSAGTGSDLLARSIGQVVSEKTKQPVVIENREGGGSLVGTMEAAKAPPDGYTIIIVANPFAIVPAQKSPAPYDPIKDFVPIAKVASIPLVLVAGGAQPINNIAELVAYARANPGKLSYASSGPGTSSQQEMEIFKQAAGLDIVEVGYKSTAQAMTDAVGGHVPLFPGVMPITLPHIKAGKVKAIAVFDTRRSSLLPDVPAMSEAVKVPGYVPMPVWYGFVAPAGTPKDAVETLNRLIVGAMQTPEMKERLVGMGAEPIGPTNEQFVADLRAELDKATRLAKQFSAPK
jgi:tripartite-type tricarboxylate transporter receptor subunit TctC